MASLVSYFVSANQGCGLGHGALALARNISVALLKDPEAHGLALRHQVVDLRKVGLSGHVDRIEDATSHARKVIVMLSNEQPASSTIFQCEVTRSSSGSNSSM